VISYAELVWSLSAGKQPLACSKTFSTGSNGWERRMLIGDESREDGLQPKVLLNRSATAEDTMRGQMHSVFGFEPEGVVLKVRGGSSACTRVERGRASDPLPAHDCEQVSYRCQISGKRGASDFSERERGAGS
jgi:hypothetical protein